MKAGKILDNVGFRKMDGTIRRLTIREQLIRNKQFVGINEIKHPMLGVIPVDRSRIDELLKYEEGHLIRFKKSMFDGNL
jgi:hypothetical protein